MYPFIKAITNDVIMTRVDPPFGDCVWTGNGPNDSTLQVAVEYKKINDILDCMIDGRFTGHQLIGLVEHYDRRYLLIEGRIRTDRNSGVLQKMIWDNRHKKYTWVDIVRGGIPMLYRDFEHWLTTIEEQAQFRVKFTSDEHESARWVAAKHSWYTYKTWDEHKALKQFHVPPPPTASFQKPSLVRRVAKEFSGVGWDRSAAVAARFQNVRQMVCASEAEWREVDGIGKTIAARIVWEVTGGGGKIIV